MRSRVGLAAMSSRGLAILVLVSLLGTAQSAGVSASSHPTQRAGNAVAAPVDTSKVTFDAIRQFGMPIVPGQPFFLRATRAVPTGPMHFEEIVDGSPVHIGTPTWSFTSPSQALYTVDSPTAGMHTYHAVFGATDEWDAFTLVLELNVQPAPIDLTISAYLNPVETNHEVVLDPMYSGANTGAPMTGTLEWRNADTDAVIDTTGYNESLVLATLPVGTHRFIVSYSGDETHSPATSPVFELQVVPDSVDATGVGLEYGTFYPVKDGYRDTVAIKGSRAEPIAVSIRVYDPKGKRVRSASVANGTGKYSYRWNGRNSAGTILAAGTYKVVQKLTDSHGTSRSVTSYVKLSKKKLVTYTRNVTKLGSALSAKGKGGTGSVKVSTGGGYALLKAGSGYALAGWEFKIPSATVYSSVAFKVYSKARFSAPTTQIAIQNFSTCPRTTGSWSDACFSRWKGIGNSTGSLKWYTTSKATSSSYRSGRYMRGMIAVPYGTVYVYKARATVVYKLLE